MTATFSLLLAGDIFIDRSDVNGVLDGLESLRAESDVVFANLEAPLTGATAGSRWRNPLDVLYWPAESQALWWMKSPLETVEELAGITAVTLANNHMLDFGVPGLLETLEVLDRAGIGHTGAGRTLAEARRPFITAAHKGVRVALLSYTSVFHNGEGATETNPGTAILKVHTSYEPPRQLFVTPGAQPEVHTWVDDHVLRSLEREIAAAKKNADVVVMGFHWGTSDGRRVEEYQAQLAHACIDAGASVIHGAHPHRHGPMEVYKGCPILYSLGQVAFDTLEVTRNTPSTAFIHGNPCVLIRCLIDEGRIVRLEIIPVSPDENNNPVLRGGREGEEIVQRVMNFPGTRDLPATWNGSRLLVELDPQ